MFCSTVVRQCLLVDCNLYHLSCDEFSDCLLSRKGVPYGRGLGLKHWVKEQGDHDKSFPILDCTQRLKGYTYVLSIDMDEVLMPAKHNNIKEFAKEIFAVSCRTLKSSQRKCSR